MEHDLQALRAALPSLNGKDLAFARNLLDQQARRGLSERQLYWVKRLAEPKAKPAAIAVGDLSGLLRLFERARQNLKRPAIVISSLSGPLKISVAGAQARQPGTVNVAEQGPFGEARWYGRIQLNGSFEPSPREATPAGLTDTLMSLAQNPAKAASEHGRLTGRCCFCNLALKDERSTAVGYGSTCAKNYGLPWGEAKVNFQELAA